MIIGLKYVTPSTFFMSIILQEHRGSKSPNLMVKLGKIHPRKRCESRFRIYFREWRKFAKLQPRQMSNCCYSRRNLILAKVNQILLILRKVDSTHAAMQVFGSTLRPAGAWRQLFPWLTGRLDCANTQIRTKQVNKNKHTNKEQTQINN